MKRYAQLPKVYIPPIASDVDESFFPVLNTTAKKPTTTTTTITTTTTTITTTKYIPPVAVTTAAVSFCAQCGAKARLPHRTGSTLRFYCKTHHPFNK
jgi:hypothetical protein